MNKSLKTLGAVLLVAAVSAVSFGQIIPMGVGKSYVGKTVDMKSFQPQINTTFRATQMEREHELDRRRPLGQPSNLIAGGTLSGTRISLTSPLFKGMGSTGAEPPDPDLGVGPNHIVEVVNTSIAFFTKTGTKLFEQPLDQWFSSVSPEPFESDPKVIYDQVAKRWVVIILSLKFATSGGISDFLIGVSNTSDPTGTWKQYKVSNLQTVGSNTYWLDYPGFGYNKDLICMAGNMFAMDGSTGYNGVQLVAFNKATLYGGTATPTSFSMPNNGTTQFTKTLDGTNPAVYAIEAESQNSILLTALSKSGSAITTTQASVPVPQWEYDQGFLVGPGNVVVQTNDPRLLVASSYNGRIVTSHHVAVSNSDLRPAARWYDIKTNGWPVSGTPTLFQSGQVNPPAGHGYSFPAINIDKKFGIGMTFSMIGTTTPGKVMGTGRRPSDPPGTMGSPIVLENSNSGTYNGFSTRWGDYFDVELDPNDSSTFWAVGMGAGSNGRWQTYMKNFKVSLPDSELIQVMPSGVTTVAGTLLSGNKNSLFSQDAVTLNIQSKAVSGLGQVGGFNSVYTLPFSGGVDTLRAFVTASGPTGSSALVSLLNVQKGVYEQVTTFGLTPSGASKALELTPAQIALYVSSTKQVSMIVRAVSPTRPGAAPTVFTFKTDQATLGAAEVVN
ncbi:MAG: hypothetical protein WCI55_03000 [Armatimonadota bacterium]